MKKYLIAFILPLVALSLPGQEQKDYTQFVNPFIGTDNYGATNPGAIAPRGMISVTPFNVAGEGNKHDKDIGWWSTPYTNENSVLTGYSHVNLSGVGCPDLGAILLMPTKGDLQTNYLDYASTYRDEKASAGYYSNYLEKHNVKVELTSSQRASVSRYTFEKGKANILLNLGLALTTEQGAYLRVKSNTELEGFRTLGSFCYNNPDELYPVYFVIKIDTKADDFGAWKKPKTVEGYKADWMSYNGKTRILHNYQKPIVGDSIGAFFSYNFEKQTQVEVKVAISYVSIENAWENLNSEIGDKHFDQVAESTKQKWNDVLSVVDVEGGSENDKIKFYTALYHTQIHPNILNDNNGEYPEIGTNQIGKTNHDRYTVFSLWDTYRNMHQLMTLLYPNQQLDMVKSMIDMYNENGWLPKWELNSTETFTMVGDPAAIVIADSYLKGLKDFDSKLALKAMLKSANTIDNNPLRPDLNLYLKYKYIPVQKKFDGSVSTTLEYTAADFAISQFAKALGEKKTARVFAKRANYYKNMYDKSSGLMRPRLENKKWWEPFDPMQGANFTDVTGFVEGTAWHYTFMVPFDVKGLIRINGGEKKFVSKLQKVFDDNLFEPDNEPDLGYPYLFNYVGGQEWRTQKEVAKIIENDYKNTSDGLPGNDDTGTMSAWLAFSMMGIYPDAPAVPRYTITKPVFDKVTIRLNNKFYKGAKFVIIKHKESGNDGYIKELKLNGKTLKSFFIDHSEIVNGGLLEVVVE